ncbi:DUF1428 domain-containing protein [Robiginitomaculum antarcticum]|uniref:DUF1428 domain-containing protein n=1 Tax=Robiginitomaculum antarcticum TaxID=437507 RepID=UPI0003810FC7|nr:DUF1428 domain-containing protein [Robiginitomaculum antarcticum]
MSYIEGFVAAVPKANKEAYREHAKAALPMFQDLGVTRMVESWEDDIKDGKLNDLRMAVNAKSDEEVVFSWMEYPDKAARDAATVKMENDPRMGEMMANMPFDGKRMIFGGFAPLYDENSGGTCGYIDGCLVPVPEKNKAAFTTYAKKSAAMFMEHGATRVIDTWGDDIPDGKVTDYRRAVHAEDGETVDFGWVEWPSKETRDTAWEKIMSDESMAEMDHPFDGKRMIFGGFKPILDE